MKKITIDPNKEYKMSEVARPDKDLNPKGLGLIPLGYLAVRRRVKKGSLLSREERVGKRSFYFIKGSTIIDYRNKDINRI